MQIHFERSGGFAATRLTIQVDAATLSVDEVQKLDELVEAADFFNLPATIMPARPKPDRYQYVVTVERNDVRHTVRTSEETTPPPLLPFLDYLTQLAIKRARG